jgi:ABC-2 type transport system ATP-binding protein
MKGELFAFLGANGSGKTTTIRCLLDIYQPDSGELLINGQKYSTDMASILGYLPEERGLYNNSAVLETMEYFGMIKGMTQKDAQTAAMDYLEKVGLADKAFNKIKTLSSGQQQKIQLGITIINRPKLLILDEPTKGLDPVNRELLLDILKEMNKDDETTIFFSTHQMDEVEKIADRLLMLKDGRSVLYGAVNKVRKDFGENIIHLEFTGKFKPNPKLFTARTETNYAELTPLPKVESDKILDYLVSSGLNIRKFEVAAPSLNEIFIKVASQKNG